MRYLLVILFALFSIVLSGQWVDTTWRYEDTTRFITEKHPKYGPWNKPTSLNDRGLVATWNFIPSAGGVLTDISGNGFNGAISGGIGSVNGMVFNGIIGILLGDTPLSNDNFTFVARIKPAAVSANRSMIGGIDAGNPQFRVSSSGVLALLAQNQVIIGSSDNAVSTDAWSNVVVTYNEDGDYQFYVNGVDDGSGNNDRTLVHSDMRLSCSGLFGVTEVFQGEIEDIKIYNYVFTEQQAQDYHNSFAKRVVLIDNFEYDAVGSVPREWQIESGTFAIAEDATSKYISCTGNGNIVFHGADLSVYFESGWIKTLTGDLSGDQDDTVDNATSLAYSSGKLTVTMTSGQKLRELIITQAEE